MIGVVVVVLFAVLVVFGARGDGAPPFDLAPPEPGAQDSQSPGSQRTVHASPGREESRARGTLRADPRSSAYTGFNADIRTRETLAAERGRTRGAASSEWFATWLTDVSTCGPKVVTDWEWVTRVAPRDPPRRLVRDAREAEEHAAAWVRALGWADAQPTQFSVDGGLDVFSLLQKNVLDRRRWATREELRIAIVTWVERTYHRRRRQAALGRLTRVEYELIMTTTATQAA